MRPKHTSLHQPFADAYHWMVSDMSKRIGSLPDGVQYPVWTWYQMDGKRQRHDPRYGGYAPHGTPLILLTIDIDERDVVLSDFDDWHFVLNLAVMRAASHRVGSRPQTCQRTSFFEPDSFFDRLKQQGVTLATFM